MITDIHVVLISLSGHSSLSRRWCIAAVWLPLVDAVAWVLGRLTRCRCVTFQADLNLNSNLEPALALMEAALTLEVDLRFGKPNRGS